MGNSEDGAKYSTRDRLMRSTLKVIARVGYANTTVAEIERDAGLSPGAGGLYRHFSSKEELLVAAVRKYREEIQTWRGVVDDIAFTPSEAWERVPRELVKFGASQQTAIMALALEGLKFPDEARKEVQAAYNDGYALFADGLEKFTGPTKADVDFEAAAIQLFAGLVQFVTQTLAFGAPPSGVPLDRYMISWLRNWSLVIAGWRAGEASSD